jgi:2-keto-4-pentenoate hydratase
MEASMNKPQQEGAAQFLAAARRSSRPGARLPESCRPADFESAFAIQRRVGEILELTTGGWKCSVPSRTGQLNVARILAPFIVRTSRCAVDATGATVKIEPEIAFVMGRELAPRDMPYSEAEVRAAIAETRLVLELLGTRYADPFFA